jgi:hypothetical protein
MKGIWIAEVGKITDSPILRIRGLRSEVVTDVPLASLMASWKRTLSGEV